MVHGVGLMVHANDCVHTGKFPLHEIPSVFACCIIKF